MKNNQYQKQLTKTNIISYQKDENLMAFFMNFYDIYNIKGDKKMTKHKFANVLELY